MLYIKSYFSSCRIIYFSFSDAGLCGVHCLNNLLQGTYYSEVDLMEIAHGLDAAERAVMSEMGTDTSDFAKFIAVGR